MAYKTTRPTPLKDLQIAVQDDQSRHYLILDAYSSPPYPFDTQVRVPSFRSLALYVLCPSHHWIPPTSTRYAGMTIVRLLRQCHLHVDKTQTIYLNAPEEPLPSFQHAWTANTCSPTSLQTTPPLLRKMDFQRTCKTSFGSWMTWRVGSKELRRLGIAMSRQSRMRVAFLDTQSLHRAPTACVMHWSPTKARIACFRLPPLASVIFTQTLSYASPSDLFQCTQVPTKPLGYLKGRRARQPNQDISCHRLSIRRVHLRPRCMCRLLRLAVSDTFSMSSYV